MSSSNCWNCGQEVSSKQKHCPHCGIDLKAPQEQTVLCSHGHKVSVGAQFCPWCGEYMGEEEQSLKVPSNPLTISLKPNKPLNPSTLPEYLPENPPKYLGRQTIKILKPLDKQTIVVQQEGRIAPKQETSVQVAPLQKASFQETVLEGIIIEETPLKEEKERALVGFLVSYTVSSFGSYFTLKEGSQNIGCREDMKIRVIDKLLSEEHAIILYHNGKFIFEDRLSSNGSLINGKEAIGQIIVNHGDRIEMGSHTYFLVTIPR
jgi:hypothetical protein